MSRSEDLMVAADKARMNYPEALAAWRETPSPATEGLIVIGGLIAQAVGFEIAAGLHAIAEAIERVEARKRERVTPS